MTPEDAEEFTQTLEQTGAGWSQSANGWWRQRALGVRLGVPRQLGLSIEDWSERLGGYIRMAIPDRRDAHNELADEGFHDHEIAAITGVSESTVQRDLRNSDDPEDQDEQTNDQQENDPETDLQLQADAEDQLSVIVDEDAPSPEVPPEPLAPAVPGWHKLGEHLLYCGDSTDPEFIEACQSAAFAFADPPYNAGKAEWDQGFEWRHDYLAEAAGIVAVTPGIAALAGFLATTEMPYRWSMAAEITNGMTSGALRFGNWICVTLFAHGSIYRKAKDHVRIPAATGDDQGGGHASRKPLRLLTHLIELFTTKGDTIVDPFLGSGTTLIAADRTGRRCVGAELDPRHCAEIVVRYHSAVDR